MGGSQPDVMWGDVAMVQRHADILSNLSKCLEHGQTVQAGSMLEGAQHDWSCERGGRSVRVMEVAMVPLLLCSTDSWSCGLVEELSSSGRQTEAQSTPIACSFLTLVQFVAWSAAGHCEWSHQTKQHCHQLSPCSNMLNVQCCKMLLSSSMLPLPGSRGRDHCLCHVA